MSDYEFYKTKRKKGTKLLRPMGFEFTLENKVEIKDTDCFHWYDDGEDKPKIDDFGHENSEGDYSNIVQGMRSKGYIANADNCLEINSPIFIYLEDVLEFYIKMRKDAGPDLIPRRRNSTGGGTHIHIDVSKGEYDYDNVLAKKLFNVVWNRPWLTWAFQNPSDDGSSIPVAFKGVDLEEIDNKCISIRKCVDYMTMELRFFDVVNNIKDLEAYVQTANYLVKLALTSKEKRTPKLSQLELFNILTKNKGLILFNNFKKDSGIKFKNNRFKQCMLWAKHYKRIFYNTPMKGIQNSYSWFTVNGVNLNTP